MNRTVLQALTLAGLTVTRPVHDPLAVLSLDNGLYIWQSFFKERFVNKIEEKSKTDILIFDLSLYSNHVIKMAINFLFECLNLLRICNANRQRLINF